MLVLLRSDILANKSLAIHVIFQFLDRIGAPLLRDCLELVEPDMGHLASEAIPCVVILLAVSILLASCEQCNIFGADAPGLHGTTPGNLNILAVGLECFQNLNPLALKNGFHRSSQDVVLLHMVVNRHLAILETLLRADELVA